MPGGVNLILRAEIEGDYTSTQGAVPDDGHIYFDQDTPFLTGSGVGQADTVYSQELFLGPSGTETLDLQSGLTDALGQAVDLARVKAIVLVVSAASGSVTLAGGASNPFLGPLSGTTPAITTNPGGTTMLVASDATAWPVTGSACNIKLTNNSSSLGVQGTLWIVGSST